MKEELNWHDIVAKEPVDFLTDDEYKIYTSALNDFNERLQHTKPKDIKKFAESGLGISAMRFARQFANPHEKGNLYKAIYKIVMNHQYSK
jgi:hypothetical protein